MCIYDCTLRVLDAFVTVIVDIVAAFCEIFDFIMLVVFFFNNLFLAALGLRRCVQAFSSCGKLGLLVIVVHRLLIAVASLVAEHRL